MQWREGGIQTIGNIQPGFLYQVSPEETDKSPALNEALNHLWQWVSSFDTGVRSLPQDPSLRQPLLPVKKNDGDPDAEGGRGCTGRSMNLMGSPSGKYLTLYRETHPETGKDGWAMCSRDLFVHAGIITQAMAYLSRLQCQWQRLSVGTFGLFPGEKLGGKAVFER